MKKAVFLRMIAVTAAALCLGLMAAAFAFDIKFTNEARASLVHIASAFAAVYNDSDAATQAESFKKADKAMRVTIISPNGEVVYDTNASTQEMGNHAKREEIAVASVYGTASAVRYSATLGSRLVYAAAKTPNGHFVRLSKNYSSLFAGVRALIPWLLLAFLLAFLFALVLAKRFSRSVLLPVGVLREGLKKVKNGKTALNISEFKYSELAAMAADINDISAEIGRNMQVLEDWQIRTDYILDNMTQGLVILDENDNILQLNTFAASSFECEKSAVIGKNIVRATRGVALLDAVSTARSTREAVRAEMMLPRARVGEANVTLVQESENIIITISDITDRANSVKMRSEFFEAASHELKTPITSIAGFAELLSTAAELPKEDKALIYERISKESRRMTNLINDIIMISRLESGDISFEPELIDIGDAIKEVCEAARGTSAAAGILIECDVCNAVRTVSRKEIQELAGNLVQNAIKYNCENGKVIVHLFTENGKATLGVFNTGEIIPPQYRARIFERFFRIDKGRSKAAGGTGLGLSIVKHIANMRGYKVDLHCTQDGNTFIVSNI